MQLLYDTLWFFIKKGKHVLFLSRGDCLMTDLPEMVPLMKKNLSKNATSLTGAHKAKAFEWGSDISSIVPNINEGFHAVLAADCIYYKEVI